MASVSSLLSKYKRSNSDVTDIVVVSKEIDDSTDKCDGAAQSKLEETTPTTPEIQVVDLSL